MNDTRGRITPHQDKGEGITVQETEGTRVIGTGHVSADYVAPRQGQGRGAGDGDVDGRFSRRAHREDGQWEFFGRPDGKHEILSSGELAVNVA